MDMNFKQLLGDATRLTREGDLVAATRSIREALGTRPPAPTDRNASVAREDRDATRAAREGVVIDGEWEASGGAADASSTRTRSASVSGEGGIVSRARHVGRSRELDYRLFVPPLAPDARPPALVVMLHGCTQDADDFAVGTGMDALALEHGFVVLYPEQSGRANPQRCWNWFKDTHQRRGSGEPALIEGAIRDVIDAHGIDSGRVFVAGLSAGGAMAAILGEVCPELVRAVGVHSGLAAGSARDLPGALAAMRGGLGGSGQGSGGPAGFGGLGGLGAGATHASGDVPTSPPPPTIVFHGDGDRTVHPDNGERVVDACLEASHRASGMAAAPEREEGRTSGRGWTREVHRDARGAPVAEHWRVHGAAHAWSGGDARGSWTDAAGPDASAEMVRFFLAAGAR